jgi:very-short-patch-repair endonuclease
MSDLEQQLAFQVRAAKLPEPVREFRFSPPRRFRFDLSWPDRKVACEIQGGVWTQGRHTRGAGAESDAEKLSLAAVDGWRVLVVTAKHVQSGEALTWIEQALR